MTLTRRALFKGMGASLLLAPSIVRASSLDYVPRQPHPWQRIAPGEYRLLELYVDRRIHFPRDAHRVIMDGLHIHGNRGQVVPIGSKKNTAIHWPSNLRHCLMREAVINVTDRETAMYVEYRPDFSKVGLEGRWEYTIPPRT